MEVTAACSNGPTSYLDIVCRSYRRTGRWSILIALQLQRQRANPHAVQHSLETAWSLSIGQRLTGIDCIVHGDFSTDCCCWCCWERDM